MKNGWKVSSVKIVEATGLKSRRKMFYERMIESCLFYDETGENPN